MNGNDIIALGLGLQSPREVSSFVNGGHHMAPTATICSYYRRSKASRAKVAELFLFYRGAYADQIDSCTRHWPEHYKLKRARETYLASP